MSKKIHETFSRIHEHYDFFNHLFSAGLDIGWRKEAARHAMLQRGEYKVLDLATGTGDLAIAVSSTGSAAGKNLEIIATDFNNDMLEHARQKAERKGLKNIRFEIKDALSTGYPASSFDVVTTAFSLRNFDDLDRFAAEMHRVLKKGGRFVLIDMAKPDNAFQRAFMGAYFSVINFVGGTVSKGSYRWLTYSIWRFDKENMAKTLRSHRFEEVKLKDLRAGVAFMITGRKA